MFVAILALTISLSSASVAAVVIHGNQIKKNTVASAQIKNKTIKLQDIAPKTRRQLRGKTGAKGADGANSTDTIPSGKTLTGSVYYEIDSSAVGQSLNRTVSFPARAPVALISAHFAVDDNVETTDDDVSCTGTYLNPTAPAGKVCAYIANGAITAQSLRLSSLVPGGDLGFVVRAQAKAVGGMSLDFSWAYTAP